VRILLPEHSDVGLVALAMTSLYTRLLRDGVELYAYRPTMMHAKTAIFDARWTTMGSHNLDSLSWHFNLECNVLIDSEEFAQLASRSFERDIARAKRLDLVSELRRGWWSRAAAWFVALFRYFL
jgi:cardiolipin synthase